MKKFPSLLLTAAALLFAPAVFASTFEGKVTMKMTSPKGDSNSMTFSLKEGVSRIDMEGKGGGKVGAMIMDMPKQQMIILMDEQKMYMVQPITKPSAQPQPAQPQQAPRSDVTLDKTGETEKILGYTCEKYVAKSKDGSSDIWVTDQLGTFMGTGAGGNPMGGRRGNSEPQPWEKALMGKNFFPLRTVVFDKSGKESFRMEATSVEKQSLPSSLFAPPADYKKFEMPSIGDMMKGMIPGGR